MLAPGRADLSAFVRETNNQDKELPAVGRRKDHVGVIERFGFDGGDSLRRRERYGGKQDDNRSSEQDAAPAATTWGQSKAPEDS